MPPNSRPRMNTFNNTFSVNDTSNTFFDPTDSLVISNPDGFQILVPLLPQNLYNLTLSLEDLLTPKLPSNGRIPRPQNAWMLFRKDFTARIKSENNKNNKKLRVQDISQLASNSWNNQPSEVKQFFDILHICAKQLHKLAYPNYVFRPARRNEAAPRIDSQVPSQAERSENLVYQSPQYPDISSSENVLTLDDFFYLTVSELNNF